jgi:tetratricopeptide (TPR) repeat protein
MADRTGDAYGRGLAHAYLTLLHKERGDLAAAERVADEWNRFRQSVREERDHREPIGGTMFSDWITFYLASARVDDGGYADAMAALRSLLDRADSFMVSCSRGMLAEALVATGDLEGARAEGARALEEGAMFPLSQEIALGALALLELAAGRPEEALAYAERGLKLTEKISRPRDVSVLRLAHVEALHALGRLEEARAAVATARDRLLTVAETIEDARGHDLYLTRVPANARTMARAQEWLGAAEDQRLANLQAK